MELQPCYNKTSLHMAIGSSLQRALAITFTGVLAALYGCAVAAPAIGLDYEEAALLDFGRHYLPLSASGAPWLRILPLVCTALWIALVYRLLRKLGALKGESAILCGLTLASPIVVFLAVHLNRQPLLALLVTASLLALLNTRPILSGLLAGAACLVQLAGVAVIVSAVITLAARRRLRDAVLFAASSMLLLAPGIGWRLAHGTEISSVWTQLRASEKAVVAGANFISLLESPALLLSGSRTIYGALVFAAILLWSLWKRRQFMPDLFVAIACALLLMRIWPPERAFALLLPLVLWMLYRAHRGPRASEILAAAAILLLGLELTADARRLFALARAGDFPAEAQAAAEWGSMRQLFAAIRANVPPDGAVLASLNDAIALETGRRTLRGYSPDPYRLFYDAHVPAITPDGLTNALRASGARFVALTPDRGRPDGPAFHRSVEALERGGLLEPVASPDLPRGYRLLRAAGLVSRP